MPATVADPRQSHDSEKISPATIAHHTVYEKTPNFSKTISAKEKHSRRAWWVRYLASWVTLLLIHHRCQRMFGLLRIAAYGPNSAISLTQTFNRILFHVCNGRDFGVQKANNEDRRRIVFTVIHLPRNYAFNSSRECSALSTEYTWINRWVWLPQSYSWSAEQGKFTFPCSRSRLRIWSRETGSAVPSCVSLLIFILRLNLVLTYRISPDFRGGVH